MRGLTTWVVVLGAVIWMGCGGGGGSNDQGTPDPGMTDIADGGSLGDEGNPGDQGPDTGVEDPGAVPDEPDRGTPEVPKQDLPLDGTVTPDGVTAEVPGEDPGPDSLTPSQFIVRVIRDGEVPGQPVPVAGAEVAVLDNSTGQPAGPSGQTDDKGEVAFDLEAGLVFGVGVRKDTFVDRYVLDVRREWNSLDVGLLPIAVVDMVAKDIGAPWDHSTGVVVGHLVYRHGDSDEEVGCAVVESDKGGEVRYWDPQEDMPASLDKAPMTSKANSNFVVIGIPPGPVRLTAKIEGEVVATKDTISFAGGFTSTEVAVSGDANPTPSDCAY